LSNKKYYKISKRQTIDKKLTYRLFPVITTSVSHGGPTNLVIFIVKNLLSKDAIVSFFDRIGTLFYILNVHFKWHIFSELKYPLSHIAYHCRAAAA